jgi:hypothetical protein
MRGSHSLLIPCSPVWYIVSKLSDELASVLNVQIHVSCNIIRVIAR